MPYQVIDHLACGLRAALAIGRIAVVDVVVQVAVVIAVAVPVAVVIAIAVAVPVAGRSDRMIPTLRDLD